MSSNRRDPLPSGERAAHRSRPSSSGRPSSSSRHRRTSSGEHTSTRHRRQSSAQRERDEYGRDPRDLHSHAAQRTRRRSSSHRTPGVTTRVERPVNEKSRGGYSAGPEVRVNQLPLSADGYGDTATSPYTPSGNDRDPMLETGRNADLNRKKSLVRPERYVNEGCQASISELDSGEAFEACAARNTPLSTLLWQILLGNSC